MLEVKHLNVMYEQGHKVIDDVSFVVEDGECIVITGQSGSGKTSIINALNGLGPKYDGAIVDGEILLDQRPIQGLETYEIAKMISNVFQNPKTHFFNVNTTLELMFYLENLGFKRDEMVQRLNEMLDLFHIEHLLDRDIFKLSGGEKQILCIASCYMANTKIILLDEPSANLDWKYIAILKKTLCLLKQKGISLIISEHRLNYLVDLVDAIYIVNNHKLIQYTPHALKRLMKEEHALSLRSLELPCLDKPSVQGTGQFYIKSMTIEFTTKKEVLEVSDLRFQKGKIYGIIGFNGCGKSTFIKTLIGLNKVRNDDVYFEEKRITRHKRIKESAYVAQDVNHQLFSDEVLKEVVIGIDQYDQKKLEDVLKQLDVFDLRTRHPFSLSGGQKQRVMIASVIMKQAKFIYFDEPTSGMDYSNMVKISNMIKDTSTDENIIFIVSHDIELLNETVDYVVCLEDYVKKV